MYLEFDGEEKVRPAEVINGLLPKFLPPSLGTRL